MYKPSVTNASSPLQFQLYSASPDSALHGLAPETPFFITSQYPLDVSAGPTALTMDHGVFEMRNVPLSLLILSRDSFVEGSAWDVPLSVVTNQ